MAHARTHELPPLPYAMDALEPYLSAETLEYHYGEHHRGYVDKLNALIPDTELADMPLTQIVTTAGQGPIFDNAAQVWNHTFYWQSLSPDGGGEPTGPIADAIARSFESTQRFKQAFNNAVKGLFGSGWVWLVQTTDDTVAIEQTANAGNPMTTGRVVLLTCDVWEHAYYIDYRNDKGRYLDAFWSLVNWDFVTQNMGR